MTKTCPKKKETLQFTASATKVLSAIPDQRRRRYMSRRSGQNGRIEKKGNVLYARFWLDVPGRERRVYKSVRICPVHGPGSLNKFEQKRRLKEIIAEFGANSEELFRERRLRTSGPRSRNKRRDGLRKCKPGSGDQSNRVPQMRGQPISPTSTHRSGKCRWYR